MALEILDSLTAFINSLSLNEALSVLEPLIIFVITMTIYSVFVYKFYKFISRRDIFRLSKGGEASSLKRLVYGLEYLFLFPFIAFFWFFVIAVLLSMLSEVLIIGNVFMVSMATLATIRLAAYYHEDLSKDIAKLIPFALLAIFLLDITTISLDVPLSVLGQLPTVIKTLVYYFIFIVIIEFILKIAFHGRKTSSK